MRVLQSLLLVALLIPAIPAHADLSESEGLIGISAREVGWVVRFPREGFKLLAERDRPDGRAHYYLFSHGSTGLNVSVRIEPAGACTTAEACREAYWRDRSPELATAELLDRSERNGFALLEFTVKFQVPQLAGRTVEQQHLSGHVVRDGYWVDLHLSMMPYTQSDRQIFLDFVDAIRVEPKPR